MSKKKWIITIGLISLIIIAICAGVGLYRYYEEEQAQEVLCAYHYWFAVKAFELVDPVAYEEDYDTFFAYFERAETAEQLEELRDLYDRRMKFYAETPAIARRVEYNSSTLGEYDFALYDTCRNFRANAKDLPEDERIHQFQVLSNRVLIQCIRYEMKMIEDKSSAESVGELTI